MSLRLARQPSVRVNKENFHDRTLRSGKLTLSKESQTSRRKALKQTTNCAENNEDLKSTVLETPKLDIRVQPLPIIPEGVTNIDSHDESNPQLCSEYAPLMFAYLRQLEAQYPIRKDFLKNCHVNGRMRAILIDWLISVHSEFKLLQETLYLSVYLIDSFLQIEGLQFKRSKFQLLGISAMFTASKVEEMYAPELNDFVYITDNAYSPADIRQMELKILATLNFNVTRPLPLHFLRRFSKAADVNLVQHTLAKYFIELSLVDYEMAHVAPSLVAAASLFLSLAVLLPEPSVLSVWTKSLEYYSNYKSMEVLPIVCRIAAIAFKSGQGKLKAVNHKFNCKKLLFVSQMSELKCEFVEKLAVKYLNASTV